MHIRTPRRYRGTRRNIIPFGRILLILVGVAIIVAGIGVYRNADFFRPYIDHLAGTALMSMQSGAQTLVAPTPTATRDPRNDLVSANNFWSGGAVSEALRLYLTILDSLPNDVTVYYRVTTAFIIQGDIPQAVEYAERTVTANPFSSDAWAIRAWALDWAGRTGDAIASALQAKELDPENPRALAWLAEAYNSAGQVQRAYDTAQRALEIDPNSIEALRARALINWTGLLDNAAAAQDYQAAFELAQATDPALAGLIATEIARIEFGNQNHDAAIQILERILEQNPENTSALFWIGQVYFSGKGDPSQAASYAQRCLDFNPNHIACNYLYGRTQMQTNVTVAAEAFAKAVELGSTSARHYWWAGRAQIDLGNCARAISFLQPGYALALKEGNATLISDYEDIMPLCGLTGAAQPTPTSTPEDR